MEIDQGSKKGWGWVGEGKSEEEKGLRIGVGRPDSRFKILVEVQQNPKITPPSQQKIGTMKKVEYIE